MPFGRPTLSVGLENDSGGYSVADGDIWRVTIGFTNDQTSKPQSTAFALEQVGATIDVADLGARVLEWWETGYGGALGQKTRHTDDVKLRDVTIRQVSPAGPAFGVHTYSPVKPGTLSGDMEPAASSILCSLRTGLAGRSYRGRMYLPPTGEGLGDSQGNLTTTVANDVALCLMGMFSDITATHGHIPGVWSATANAFTAVDEVKVDQRLRSQRRRAVRQPVYASAT